jgi:hypothetical protein
VPLPQQQRRRHLPSEQQALLLSLHLAPLCRLVVCRLVPPLLRRQGRLQRYRLVVPPA